VFFGLLLFAIFVSSIASAQPDSQFIVATFNVPVDAGSSAFMHRVVDTAVSSHARAIVIVMNTPGGLLSDMINIVNYISQANRSGIPTYTYVPPDSLAASAGSYIAMATNEIVMGSGSEIGPSTPIVVGGTPLEQNHTESAMLSYMVALAREWGRNTTAATLMVLSDASYSSTQALEYHLINGIANNLSTAFSMFGLQGSTPVVLSENYYEQFLSVLSNSTVDGLLILLGELAILIDLYHPTIVISVVGAIAIVAGLVGLEVIGASVLGFFLLAVAAALILIELKLGHGFAMIAGVIIGGTGILLLSQNLNYSGPSPRGASSILLTSAAVAAGVVASLYIRWALGPLAHRKKLTGADSLIGRTGVVTAELTPEGEVRVEGIIWRAVSISGERIPAGKEVVIKEVRGLRLYVTLKNE
jgi:membrane-bound serine protease (ClpP class)